MTTLNELEIDKADAAADPDVPDIPESDTESTSKDEIAPEDSATADSATADTEGDATRRHRAWSRVLAFAVLPGLALVLALVVGYLKWLDRPANDFALARTESVRVASEDAVALLSYRPESVERDLGAARERLTGDFKDAYGALTREVVIPGAKEKRIAVRAKVTAAAAVSVSDSHAVVLAFMNQTVTIGDGAPTDTTPVLRVTLDKVNGKWLVSHFDPV